MNEEKKSKKMTIKKLLVFIIIVITYIQLGNIFYYHAEYGSYYKNSLQTKILLPASPIFLDSPFNKECPIIDQEKQKSYKDFETYLNQESVGYKIATIIFWPLFLIIFWGLSALSWIVWILLQIYLLTSWFWNGGIAQALGLIP